MSAYFSIKTVKLEWSIAIDGYWLFRSNGQKLRLVPMKWIRINAVRVKYYTRMHRMQWMSSHYLHIDRVFDGNPGGVFDLWSYTPTLVPRRFINNTAKNVRYLLNFDDTEPIKPTLFFRTSITPSGIYIILYPKCL